LTATRAGVNPSNCLDGFAGTDFEFAVLLYRQVVLSLKAVRALVVALFFVSLANFVSVDLHAAPSAQTSHSNPSNPCDDSGDDGGHDCFACCSHLIPSHTFAWIAELQPLEMIEAPEPSTYEAEPQPYFHPPKV
jgi:hypothetical protein